MNSKFSYRSTVGDTSIGFSSILTWLFFKLWFALVKLIDFLPDCLFNVSIKFLSDFIKFLSKSFTEFPVLFFLNLINFSIKNFKLDLLIRLPFLISELRLVNANKPILKFWIRELNCRNWNVLLATLWFNKPEYFFFQTGRSHK